MQPAPDPTWNSGGEHRAESELRHCDEGRASTNASSLELVSAGLEQNQDIQVSAWKISYRYFLRLKAVESLVFLIFSTIWTEMTWTARFFWDKAVSDSFLIQLIMNRHLISALGALCSFLLLLHPPMQSQQNKEDCKWWITWAHPILQSKCPMSALYWSICKCAYESRQFVLRFTKNISNSPCVLTSHSNYFQKSIMCIIILFSAQRGFFFPASQVTAYFYTINCYKLS